MRSLVFWSGALTLVAACNSFADAGSEPAGPTSAPVDGGNGDAPGIPGTSNDLAIEALDDLQVIQGESAKLKVTVKRSVMTGPVAVTIENLPAGLSAEPAQIAAGSMSTELTIKAAVTVKQGALSPSVKASANDVKTTRPLALLVRGPAGSLDTTFGEGGQLSEVFGNSTTSVPKSTLPLPDGRTVIIAGCLAGLCATRLMSDGKIDLSFGAGGRTNIADGGSPWGAALASDGGVLIGAARQVIKLKSDGKIDTTFGGSNTGFALIDLQTEPAATSTGTMALAADDSITVAFGVTETATLGSIVVFKLTGAGLPVSAFGSGGRGRLAASSPPVRPLAIAVRATGQVFGVLSEAPASDVAQGGIYGFQFLADGSPDAAFGSGGLLPYRTGKKYSSTQSVGFTIHPDGRTLVPYNGTRVASDATNGGVIAIKADGSLDTTFGIGSSAAVGGIELAKVTGVAAAPNGRIVAAREALYAFTATGVPDAAFGVETKARLNTKSAYFDIVAAQPDSRILAAGYWVNDATGEQDLLVSRFWP